MKRKAIVFLLFAAVFAVFAASSVSAVKKQCEIYEGSNIEEQNYSTYGKRIMSYLVPTSGGGVMRVQAGGEINGVLVEYYDAAHNIDDSKTKLIARELPIFGAFYASDDAYYILSGQRNYEELAETEVFRVTKYNKNWKRIGAVGISDCNTTLPFNAASARMESVGKYLIVHTSHEMYMTSDGLNHQSNATFEIDTEKMELTDGFFDIDGYSGYVSHSFNQFLHIDGGTLVAVDHGDAFPRSVVLTKYPSDVTTGKFIGRGCRMADVFTLNGNRGDNYTGASVGAFEISDSSYLIAGNSVVQDANSSSRVTRNVFVASTDKNLGSTNITWLTKYAEGEEAASTPHMVKLSSDRFLVLWSRGGKVYYTKVDGLGKPASGTYSIEGHLSDCAPVVAGGNVTWYTWDDGIVTFYDISVSDISKSSVKVINNGHQFEVLSVKDGIVSLRCTVCGLEKREGSATFVRVFWGEEEYGEYTNQTPDHFTEGDSIYLWVTGYGIPEGVDPNNEWTLTVSDGQKLSFETRTEVWYYFKVRLDMLSPGTVSITFSPKYNPDVAETVTFRIICKTHGKSTVTGQKEATCSSEGYTGDLVCSVCGEVLERGKAIPKKPHTPVTGKAKEATCSSEGYTGGKVCSVCGEVLERGEVIPKKPHTPVTENAKRATCTSPGYTGDLVCAVCGKTVEAGKTIPKTPHEYVNGVCVVCGAKKTSGEPPVTEPPSTTASVTEPSVTEPSETTPGVTGPNVTEPSVTTPGVSEPNVTEPPAVETMGTGTPLTGMPAAGETEPIDAGSDTAEPSTTEPGVTDSPATGPSDVETDPTAVTTSAKTSGDTDDDGTGRDPDVTTSDGGDGGCSSVISVSAVMCALCAAVVCAAFKRREHENEK